MTTMRTLCGAGLVLALLGTAGVPGVLAAEAESFASPEAATEAVIDALRARDRDALLAIFGSDAEDVVFTGETAQDVEEWGSFLADYEELNRIAIQTDGTATLYLGRDQWPFPAPLVETDGGWRFDAEAAREEVFFRRIGQNELDVLELLAGYVRAQSAYRQVDYDEDGVMEFAAGVLSTAGTRDGLYWPPEPGAPESPIGDFMARAAASGYSIDGVDEAPEPYLGYLYRILQSQGEAAAGGAYDYVIDGNMVAGHAALAFPAVYGETGIMSFLVGENGVIYERDLGDDTLDVADGITVYDPDEDWAPVE